MSGSGVVRPEDLSTLLQARGRESDKIDLSHLDPDTQKLLNGLDLSIRTFDISTNSSAHSSDIQSSVSQSKSGRAKSPLFSVFKGNQNDTRELSSLTSGVWPIEKTKETPEKTKRVIPTRVRDKALAHESQQTAQQGTTVRTKIPLSQDHRTPVKVCQPVSDKKLQMPEDLSLSPRENDRSLSNTEKTTMRSCESGGLLFVLSLLTSVYIILFLFILVEKM